MLKFTLKGLWSHKRRLIGTFLAIFIGIAFLSGTLVLGDAMRGGFDTLFKKVNAGLDAQVRSDSEIDSDIGASRILIDESLVDVVRGVDGVADAQPEINVEGSGQVIDKDGDPIGGFGPPTFAGNWIGDTDLNPYKIVDGRAPEADTEVVIDRGVADDGPFEVGDTATVNVPKPLEVTIVGIATFGDFDNAGGTTYVGFTTAGAQEHVTKQPGKISDIVVAADDGISQQEIANRIEQALPDGVEAITGEQLTEEQKDDINGDFLTFFTTFLTIFAVIALIVGTFSIYNTFSIIVAQRARESALMRALGATRAQVVRSTFAEALIIGLVASLVGLLGGLGVAAGLSGLFDALGFDIPTGSLTLSPAIIIASLIVGIVVTLLAGVVPAVKASRVPPLAAMRDVALERTAVSVARVVAGFALSGLGIALVLIAVLGEGENMLIQAGVGALVTMVGVVVFGPVVAGFASRVIGSPLPPTRGMTGNLARENAMRNPRRTAGTAAALMIGVGVVTLFTVFASSLKASIDDSVSESFGGDLVVSPSSVFSFNGFSPELADEVNELPEVAGAVGLGFSGAKIDDSDKTIAYANPSQLAGIVDFDVASGSVDDLADDQMAIHEDVADDNNWDIGTSLPVQFVDGSSASFTVGAIFKEQNIAGDYLFARAAVTPHLSQDQDFQALAKLDSGVSLEQGRTAIEKVTDNFAGTKVLDRQEYVDSVASGVNQMLLIIYAMLVLAIIIALMGIANTLALSIHERTRELGLLRAVGQTRPQTRSMVRWESVIIALFGALGGVGLGLFLGWALVKAASSEGIGTFAVPPAQLIVVLVVGALAGVIAAIFPARRAARLDVLQAIATE